MKILITVATLLINIFSFAQTPDKPFIKLVEPAKTDINVKTVRNFINGSTCNSLPLL